MKTRKQIIKQFLSTLILPTIFSFLLSIYIIRLDCIEEDRIINIYLTLTIYSTLFYLLSFFEYSRIKEYKERPYFYRYLYLFSMILIFIMGIWFFEGFDYCEEITKTIIKYY